VCYPDIVYRIDGRGSPLAAILTEARARYAAGRSMRGLPRPAGYEETGYYSEQHRELSDGTTAAYLAWRWRDRGRLRGVNLGRIDDAAA
jgi:hypothetical protein